MLPYLTRLAECLMPSTAPPPDGPDDFQPGDSKDAESRSSKKPTPPRPKYALAIHGGAGVILRKNLPADLEKVYLRGLTTALEIGNGILAAGGSSMDAVEAAVRSLEDDPLFNAGRGAVFTRDGKIVHEASIMDGSTHRAGACTQTTTVRHPISLAREVMKRSPHVFLTDPDATNVAVDAGLEIVDPSFFFTEHRWRQHLEEQNPALSESGSSHGYVDPSPQGTVGAVAVDMFGRLAAATSTGGKTNKWNNRIGDTPLIGCGNYAEEGVCAVSGTGDGEFFIRNAVAYDVAARMKYGKQSLTAAAEASIADLKIAGGMGGLIAVGADGEVGELATEPFRNRILALRPDSGFHLKVTRRLSLLPKTPESPMQNMEPMHINRDRLYTDLEYRFNYVAKFVDFGPDDIKAIKDSAAHIEPLIPVVVDAVYAKLFSFDITKQVFANRMEGFHGSVIADANALKQDSEQIKFRKDMLSKYLLKLVTADYGPATVKYLDWVALIHTKNNNKKTSINVEYIHINALLTFVESVVIGAICDLPLDKAAMKRTLVAFNKLLWLQNDLFAQYYVCDGNELPDSRVNVKKVHRASTAGILSNPVAVAVGVAACAVMVGAGYMLKK
ncbi:hypothetical protein HK101_005776 [Irineochytrium annulatum]|nr:hypothetical protein HK101_005776 [Irineochytrium annulatum]